MDGARLLSRLGSSFSLSVHQEHISSRLGLIQGHLRSLLSWNFVYDQSSHLLYVFSISILAFTSWLAHKRTCSEKNNKEEERTDDALSMLTRMMIPTQSIWDPFYAELCLYAARRPEGCIQVPTSRIFLDVIEGKVELRSPSDDLPLLIGSTFEANGWSVSLQFSVKDKLRTASWLLNEELSSGLPSESFGLQNGAEMVLGEADLALLLFICGESNLDTDSQTRFKEDFQKATVSPINHSADRSKETVGIHRHQLRMLLKTVFICPSLDFVARHHVSDFLHSFKNTFQEDSRSTAYLSLTTCEKLSVFSFKFMCISKLLMRAQEHNLITRRTSSPLFCRLHSVLACLESGPAALKLIKVQNISSKYAEELTRHSKRLAYDAETRAAFIKAVGLKGWREEQLYLTWESALLKEGVISRWALLIGK